MQASCQLNSESRYSLNHTYYRDDPVPVAQESNSVAGRIRERGAVEYLHRLEQLIGGICRAGMVIEDFVEPLHADDGAAANTFAGRARYIAPYLRIKARKKSPTTTTLFLQT